MKNLAKETDKTINLIKFYSFMTWREKIYFAIGLVGAIVGGALIPSLSLIIGDVTDTFKPTSSPTELLDAMKDVAKFIFILAILTWVFCYFYYAFW